MKRSTFRKSSLISSVALLLVAIVALSGATFAWFSTSNTANASNISVTSTAAGGLLISETGAEWSSALPYNNTINNRTAILSPASSNFTLVDDEDEPIEPAFYYGEAADTGKFEAKDGFTKCPTSGYVNDYTLLAKSNDAGKIQLTVTALEDIGAYGRVAIVNNDTNKLVYYYAAEGDNDGPVTGTNKTDVDANFYTTNAAVIKATKADSANIEIGELTATDKQVEFSIFVWYEGQDHDCTTAMSGKTLSAAFQFNLVTPAAG